MKNLLVAAVAVLAIGLTVLASRAVIALTGEPQGALVVTLAVIVAFVGWSTRTSHPNEQGSCG